MAKYIVEETKASKYEKNYKFPMINLIPAIVWCIPIHQKLSPIIGTAGAYGVVAAFFVLYILLSYVPIVALAPGIASVIMLTEVQDMHKGYYPKELYRESYSGGGKGRKVFYMNTSDYN